MGKDLNGKELGTGIMQRKDGRYVGRFVNRFGKREEVKSRDLKELKTLMNTAVYEDTNHMNRCNTNITLDKWFTTWMEHYKDNTVCANTKRRYLEIYRLQISPTLSTAKPVEEFEELLFTTKFGTPINTQLYSAAIKAVLEDANLCRDELEQIEYFSPHCFRHSFATRCFEAGIKPKTVQQYLGHATLQMTMDLYTHVLKEHSMEEMSKLEKVLDNTLDVSESMINDRFDKFLDMDKDKDNIVYLASVGT